jgi:hypothetical protein
MGGSGIFFVAPFNNVLVREAKREGRVDGRCGGGSERKGTDAWWQHATHPPRGTLVNRHADIRVVVLKQTFKGDNPQNTRAGT